MAKLRPRARIIRTIGDQLISGPEAAIIELVKNSYDAEATYCEVKFIYSASEGFSITVMDDGHGMTYDEIVDNWLEPATDVKAKRSWSRNNKRRLLGAKGIGRFSVSRLGGISLLTSVASHPKSKKLQASSILVDWSLFTAEKYLEDIELDIVKETVGKDHKLGVEIEISQLRDQWTKKQAERLILELRRLSRPDDNFSIYLDLGSFIVENSGFEGAELFIEQNNSLESGAPTTADKNNLIQPFVVGEVADYRLEGTFSESGSFKGSFQVQRGDNIVQELELDALALGEDEQACGPVHVRLNVYDRELEAVANLFERMELNFSKIGIRTARKILTDMSGISISRNGFRIRPYGDPEHDWLELQAKRVQDPSKKLGSDQVSGYIEIADESSSGIIERSSREGLEVNAQYRRLKALVSNLLPHAEERRYAFREKAGIGRKPASNTDNAREASKLKQVNKALNKIPEEFRNKLVTAIDKDAASINEMLDEVDAYQTVLQSRAALGLVVAEVIHEGRRRLDPMLTSVKRLKHDEKHAFEDSEIGRLYRGDFPEEIDTLMKGGAALSLLFKRLNPISGRRRGRPSSFKLLGVVEDTLAIMNHPLKTNSIAVECDVSKEIKCYGYREDLQAGFLNIVENAIYWLSSVENDSRYINISTKEEKNKIIISIANNGPELDEAYQPRLFDAGFSLKSDGTGLGLAIAREACRASKGDLFFDPTASDVTFFVEFPKGAV